MIIKYSGTEKNIDFIIFSKLPITNAVVKLVTLKAPTKNRKIMNIVIFVAKAEANCRVAWPRTPAKSIFLRPNLIITIFNYI